MTDILKGLNDAQRRSVAEAARRARDEPSLVVVGEVLTDVIRASVLHRMGRRVGIPLRRRDWFLLLAYFGCRSEAYKMVWRLREAKPAVVARKQAADALTKIVLEEWTKALRARPAGPRPGPVGAPGGPRSMHTDPPARRPTEAP